MSNKTTILFVDNDEDFREARTELLEQAGYLVKGVSNAADARRWLRDGTNGTIDLVILDVRLVKEDDENDISGRLLAEIVGQAMPVIILTGYPSTKDAQEMLAAHGSHPPVASAYVAKQAGPGALFAAIHAALSAKTPSGSSGPVVTPHKKIDWRMFLAMACLVLGIVLNILMGITNDPKWIIGLPILVVLIWMSLSISQGGRTEIETSQQSVRIYLHYVVLALFFVFLAYAVWLFLQGRTTSAVLATVQGVVVGVVSLLDKTNKSK